MNAIVLWIFLYIYFSSVRQYHCQTLFLCFICNFIYPCLLNKNAYVYIFLFLPKFVPQTKIYLPFYIYICVYIIIYTNIFLKCAYLHTHKNISYTFCWQQSYIHIVHPTVCTFYFPFYLFYAHLYIHFLFLFYAYATIFIFAGSIY